MTAREFIESRFGVSGDNVGEAVFQAYASAEAKALGVHDESLPAAPLTAEVAFWCDVFGPTFEVAWAKGKRRQELVESLLAVPGGERGWGSYFRLWAAKGLFD